MKRYLPFIDPLKSPGGGGLHFEFVPLPGHDGYHALRLTNLWHWIVIVWMKISSRMTPSRVIAVAVLIVLSMSKMAGAEPYGPEYQLEMIGGLSVTFDACEPLDPALTQRSREAFFEALSRSEGISRKQMDVMRAMPAFQSTAQEGAKEFKGMTPVQLHQYCQEIWRYAQMPMPPTGQYLTNPNFWASATLSDTKDAIGQFKTASEVSNWTPLIIASGVNQSPDVIAALIDAWGEINTHINTDSEEDGMTALMSAASNNSHPEITVLLLRRGAQINARSANGRTALMWAAKDNANPQVIDTLIAAGADFSVHDQAGKTALDYLLDNRSPAVQAKIKMLRQALTFQK